VKGRTRVRLSRRTPVLARADEAARGRGAHRDSARPEKSQRPIASPRACAAAVAAAELSRSRSRAAAVALLRSRSRRWWPRRSPGNGNHSSTGRGILPDTGMWRWLFHSAVHSARGRCRTRAVRYPREHTGVQWERQQQRQEPHNVAHAGCRSHWGPRLLSRV
jgi:hypothetical protein